MGQVGDGITGYPRLQFWSTSDYFNGRKPNLPSLSNPHTGKPLEPSLF